MTIAEGLKLKAKNEAYKEVADKMLKAGFDKKTIFKMTGYKL